MCACVHQHIHRLIIVVTASYQCQCHLYLCGMFKEKAKVLVYFSNLSGFSFSAYVRGCFLNYSAQRAEIYLLCVFILGNKVDSNTNPDFVVLEVIPTLKKPERK